MIYRKNQGKREFCDVCFDYGVDILFVLQEKGVIRVAESFYAAVCDRGDRGRLFRSAPQKRAAAIRRYPETVAADFMSAANSAN